MGVVKIRSGFPVRGDLLLKYRADSIFVLREVALDFGQIEFAKDARVRFVAE